MNAPQNMALATLTSKLASRLDLGDGAGLVDTLKATAFKGQVSDAQMTALMVVANQYALNPWNREIYAFPDKNNGIVPVVGVDGWSRIINNNPNFDGMEFDQNSESCTCIIYRKDRSHPIKVTEYMSECKRGTGPWQSHPMRMMRHKAMIQCARIAFGFGGIFDQDEAERIVESGEVIDNKTGEIVTQQAPKIEAYSPEKFASLLPAWRKLIESGQKTADQIIAVASSKAILSDEQKEQIKGIKKADESVDPFVAEMNRAEETEGAL